MFRKKVDVQDFIVAQFVKRSEGAECQTITAQALDGGWSADRIVAKFVESSWQMVLMEASAEYPQEIANLGVVQHSIDLKMRAAEAVVPAMFYSYSLTGRTGELLAGVRQRLEEDD
jgi:hypothetical protein